MVTKQCPECQKSVPVACKTCPCGHVYFVTRNNSKSSSSSTPEDGVKRRRTERVKRERPDYFTPLHAEIKLKRMKNKQKTKKKSDNPGPNDKEEGSNSEESSETRNASISGKSKRRGRPKRSLAKEVKVETKNTEQEEATSMFNNLPKEKEEKYNIILSEINRKIMCQQFNME